MSVTETSRHTAATQQAEDTFGIAVDLSGTSLIVGSKKDSTNGNNAGAAYIFELVDGTWIEVAKLLASDAAPLDSLGRYAAIHDGCAVVSAVVKDQSTGKAYVYTEAAAWAETAQLVGSDIVQGDRFGESVDIHGTTIVVGAPLHENSTGAVYVFVLEDGVWTQQAKIQANDKQPFDKFGWSVAIEGDWLFVGAPEPLSGGSVYAFERQGTAWAQAWKGTGSDVQPNDEFGRSLAFDRDTLIVGALRDAYLFRGFAETAMMTEPGSEDYGINVDIDRTVNAAVVGAFRTNALEGRAYFYALGAAGVELCASDADPGDRFGRDVAINQHGIVVGAVGDSELGSDAGAFYWFAAP